MIIGISFQIGDLTVKKLVNLSQACDGLLRYKNAAGVSPYTLRNYRTSHAKLQEFFGKILFSVGV